MRSDTEYFACDIHTIRLNECSWAGGWCEMVSVGSFRTIVPNKRRVDPNFFDMARNTNSLIQFIRVVGRVGNGEQC